MTHELKEDCDVVQTVAAGTGMPVLRRTLVLKAAALLALSYCVLFAFQSSTNYMFLETSTEIVTEPVEIAKSNVTVTHTSTETSLDDIFISVKTSRNYQHDRLPLILKTWFQLARNQTWFFTDVLNQKQQIQTNGHMIDTKCKSTHSVKDLCCKMSIEYQYFIDSEKKWFCHFDDDNYVNVPRLVEVLQMFSPQNDWYIGKNSVLEPVHYKNKFSANLKFWFATGGAGFCISRPLALKISYFAGDGRFMSVCKQTRFPDDVSLGLAIALVRRNLTVMNDFHSHLETMEFLEPETLRDQVSFSYYHNSSGEWNRLKIPGYDTKFDPTRFLSLHKFLFPES